MQKQNCCNPEVLMSDRGGQQLILQMQTLRAEHATNRVALGAEPLALPAVGMPWAAAYATVPIRSEEKMQSL